MTRKSSILNYLKGSLRILLCQSRACGMTKLTIAIVVNYCRRTLLSSEHRSILYDVKVRRCYRSTRRHHSTIDFRPPPSS